MENPTATATGATSATRSAAVRIVLTAPNGSSKSMMTTLRFDGQTAVSDLLGLLAEQEGLTAEEAAEYVIRTPDAILSPDVHLKALVMPSLVRIRSLVPNFSDDTFRKCDLTAKSPICVNRRFTLNTCLVRSASSSPRKRGTVCRSF